MYNFLVASGPDAWDEGVYEFPRERVAIEYTEDSISERYRDLNDTLAEELKTFPTLFCVEGEEVPSRVGYITSVKLRPNRIRIEFRFRRSVKPLPSGFVAESSMLFDLGRFELSRTHWAIKEGDLWAIMKQKGITFAGLALGEPSAATTPAPAVSSPPVSMRRQVFIVHGHNEVAKLEMAAAVREMGCDPIILHEQVSGGLTVIEKIEKYSNVGFAVVLYTPCDIGGKKAVEMTLSPRARQNVVFEHGYLIGKLGRSHVMAFVEGRIETPTDISGILYIELDQGFAWKAELRKEMEAIGYIR